MTTAPITMTDLALLLLTQRGPAAADDHTVYVASDAEGNQIRPLARVVIGPLDGGGPTAVVLYPQDGPIPPRRA